jgi:RHS repeat-associated protein
MIGNNGKKYFYDKGRLSCMVNVIGGVAFDSYYIHYDAEGNPAFISVSVNGAIRERFAYLRNMQGDIIRLVNESGAVVVRYYYDAWGKLLQTEVSDSAYNDIAEKNPLRYRGYVYDTEMGMYYVESRYYNPDICRWIITDDVNCIGVGDNIICYNSFAYCLDNPMNQTDIGGNLSVSNWIKIGIGTTALICAVGLTAATGGAGAAVCVGLAKIAGSTVLNAVVGAGVGYLLNGKQGAVDGACSGYMLGGLSACCGAAINYISSPANGIDTYSNLVKANKGSGLEAHHIIEKRFSGTLNISNTNKMLAVSISKSNHRTYTNIWRKMLPYGKEYKKDKYFFLL